MSQDGKHASEGRSALRSAHPEIAQQEEAARWPKEDKHFIDKRRTHVEKRIGVDRNKSAGAPDNLTGLALSGGGIRSATFCLGVAQALNHHKLIDRMDYLSTVSGGGYFGASMASTLASAQGGFVYDGAWDARIRSEEKQRVAAQSATAGRTQPATGGDKGISPDVARQAAIEMTKARDTARSSDDLKDSYAIGHLRNYSNYLAPKGFSDYLASAAIICRGLAANAGMILWFPLLAATITVFSNPSRASLDTSDLFGATLSWPPVESFALTLTIGSLLFATFLGWALVRSRMKDAGGPDAGRGFSRIGGVLLVVLALAAFFELQPYAIKLLFNAADPPAKPDPAAQTTTSFLTWLTVLFTPLAAIVTFFRDKLKSWLADTYFSKTYAALLSRGTALAILWGGALALPLLIWIFYIHLSYWAIADARACKSPPQSPVICLPQDATTKAFSTDRQAVQQVCATPEARELCYKHSPQWYRWIVETALPRIPLIPSWPWVPYALISVFLVLLSTLLRPNTYSLHHLYRDRLAKAFLFNPLTLPGNPDPEELGVKLHDLADKLDAPYLLVNTAVNVLSSDTANRRGRNADFFVFTPNYLGSMATGYMATRDYLDGRKGSEPDLATVVAISGAAASSNMGAKTIRVLSPTLAMLNVRLGYWLRNPLSFNRPGEIKRKRIGRRSLFFLAAEMFGLMRENDPRVYLTDGGHIENLGVYELLRRRCKVIVVVDAEADPQLRFGSFITLQIYARIDLGIRINLSVDPIRDTTVATMGAGSPAKEADKKAAKAEETGKPAQATEKAHVAVGSIDYGNGEFGTLVYIKASLSGDENDYVRDYGRRNPAYPHETTGDQFFTEEQFEVYRALGFHIADRFLRGTDKAIVMHDDGATKEFLTIGQNAPPLARLREALAFTPARAATARAPRRTRAAGRLRFSRKSSSLALSNPGETIMAKGAMRPGKEARKPKKDAKKPAAAPTIKATPVQAIRIKDKKDK